MSFPTSGSSTLNLNTCQKICIKIGLLQNCSPANITNVLWTVPTTSTQIVSINTEPSSTPMSAVVTGINPGSITIEILIFLNGGVTPSFGILIPVIVVFAPPTFSIGIPVLKTLSFPTPCGSILLGNNFRPIQKHFFINK